MATKRNISFEDFLLLTKEVWGELYDYKAPETFKYSSGKIDIFCKRTGHGWFTKNPSAHIAKNTQRPPVGCPKCQREKQSKKKIKPFSVFVSDANSIHSSKYRYDEATYAGSKEYVSIYCDKHGVFKQTPDAHINGKQGCPECGLETSKEKLINRGLENAAKKVSEMSQGSVVLLEESYQEQRVEASFICSRHGEFERIVILALNSKSPCPECLENKNSKLTCTEIRAYLEKKVGNFRIISIDGEGRDAPVQVECLDCDRGIYTTSVNAAYRHEILCGNCRRLASEDYRQIKQREYHDKQRSDHFDKWLSAVSVIHNGKYDYSKVTYVNSTTPVEVICPVHGLWEIKPDNHITRGCRLCANDELPGRYTKKFFDRFPEAKKRDAELYYLSIKIFEVQFYKVGITANKTEHRHSVLNSNSDVKWEILGRKNTTLYEAFSAEQHIQSEHGTHSRLNIPLDYEEIRRLRLGPTECFLKKLPVKVYEEYFG